jgi:succinyl-CoA synthetase alpha subunit
VAESSVHCLVRRQIYRDSVELMRVAAELERLPGVETAALLMATPANRELLARAGLLVGEAAEAAPNDLVVGVRAADQSAAEAALARVVELLAGQGEERAEAAGGSAEAAPQTISAALERLPGANLAIISTPGAYASAEALKALKRGLHVFIFSDNVPLAEEVELKRLAGRKGLLVMGPDCGTAILDGVPIGFANAVRPGRIGLVGASGTGLQQVSCLIDRLGEGVSQVIGVGSHDLSSEVGGLMMQAGLERLGTDPATSVLVLVSKPPAAEVARRVLEAARAYGKPVVVNFLGGDPAGPRAAGAEPAPTLEAAARLAVALARGEPSQAPAVDQPGLVDAVDAATARLAAGQWRVRGLFSGGTLCQEAALILAAALPAEERSEHPLIDLGADEYTVGRPHPMIDFRLRNEQLVAAADDPSTAAVLLDVVLGYGSHPDPAAALLPAVEAARQRAAAAGRHLVLLGSVCGTASDPQDLARQERDLTAAGLIPAPSNAQAARLAARVALRTRPAARTADPAGRA